MDKLIALVFLYFVSGCVSVKIGDQTAKKSTRYSYEYPSNDFYRIKNESVDHAWLSSSTSSTISVKSKCIKSIELDLENWFMELASNFKASETSDPIRFKFNNRKALRGKIDATLEGFENKLAVTSFIKNSCQYILVLTAQPSNFEKDLSVYDKFLTGFKAW